VAVKTVDQLQFLSYIVMIKTTAGQGIIERNESTYHRPTSSDPSRWLYALYWVCQLPIKRTSW